MILFFERLLERVAAIASIKNAFKAYKWRQSRTQLPIYEIIEKGYYKVSFIDGDHQYYQRLFHQGNKYLIYQIVAPKNMSGRIDQIRKHLDISFEI